MPALSLIQRRWRLLNALAGQVKMGKRLITIYAPGGYGKSTLLVDFAQTTDLPICWCSLEPKDRDPTSLLTLLTHSIVSRFNDIAANTRLRPAALRNSYSGVPHVTELIRDIGPHLVIIDDFHKAVSVGTIRTLNRLLEQLPPESTLVVAARNDVAMPVDRLTDQLRTELQACYTADELRFTAAEVQKIMHKRFGRVIALADAEEIAGATQGSIAKILLVGHILRSEKMISRLGQRLGDDREMLYRYLATEILDKQPPALRRFLIHTSVLPELTIDLCNDLVKTTDAQACLEELVHKDLFTSQLGTGFRYQDLFAEFLRTKLAEDEPRYRQLCLRAATLLARHSRYEEAIDLFLSIQAWDEAANLLELHGTYYYETERTSILNSWLEQIPAKELVHHPQLLLLHGRLLNDHLQDLTLARTLFQNAEEQFLRGGDMIGAAEARVWQSVRLRQMGQAGQSLALATSGLTELKALKADSRSIAWATRHRGLAHWGVGNNSEAVADLRRALELFEASGDQYGAGRCHYHLGVCLAAQGDGWAANQHYRQALSTWKSLGTAKDLSETLNGLGALHASVGRRREALQYFTESLNTATRLDLPLQAAHARTGIGDVCLARQEFGLARDAYARSTETTKLANALSLEIYNLVQVGESFFQERNFPKAFASASQARALAVAYGLHVEAGLACTLMGRVFIHRAAYETGFHLFEKALRRFGQNNLLEQAKTRLYWAYGLLLDQRTAAAFEQLQDVIKLTPAMGEFIKGLGQTVTETRQLLVHFLHWPDTPVDIQDGLRHLLDHSQMKYSMSNFCLQVFTFGRPYLIADGNPVHFIARDGNRKMVEFLAYLLVEGRDGGCRWDQVCVDLWPDLSPDKASIKFHQALRRLRETVFEADDYLIIRDDYYWINPQLLQWCDALEFDELYARIGTVSSDEALSLMLELISLYRGEFLSGFSLGTWGQGRRSLYEKRYLQLAKFASEQLLKAGDSSKALTILTEALAHDYFREDLHRTLMRAYALLGLHDQLTGHFESLQAALRHQFDSMPEPETASLYRQLVLTR